MKTLEQFHVTSALGVLEFPVKNNLIDIFNIKYHWSRCWCVRQASLTHCTAYCKPVTIEHCQGEPNFQQAKSKVTIIQKTTMLFTIGVTDIID